MEDVSQYAEFLNVMMCVDKEIDKLYQQLKMYKKLIEPLYRLKIPELMELLSFNDTIS